MIDYEGIWREYVLPDVFASAGPTANPLLVLVGGQPGCGKTSAVRRIREQRPDLQFAQIIGDDLRQYHPDYEEFVADPDPAMMPTRTAEASAWWVRRCLQYAAEGNIPVIVEGTFRDPAVPISTAAQFPYHTCQVVVLAVPKLVSWQGCVLRYLSTVVAVGTGRWTPLPHHDLAYDAIPGTLAALENCPDVDRITVMDRDGVVAFDGKDGATTCLLRLRENLSTEILTQFHQVMGQVQTLAESRAWPAEVLDGITVLTQLRLVTR